MDLKGLGAYISAKALEFSPEYTGVVRRESAVPVLRIYLVLLALAKPVNWQVKEWKQTVP
jgi:hypothetical protein